MTKQQFLENPKKYGIEKESNGQYELAFPGNGTTVELYMDFSAGGTASEVSLQAYMEWYCLRPITATFIFTLV